jgi:putative membrane protein
MLGWLLYVGTIVFLAASGIAPHDRFTWWLEISWVLVGLVLVAVLWRRGTQFTTSLKIALFLHAAILIYGGWYTYERVPLGEWMKGAFGFARNNYDRIGHFAQGLFPAVLAREVLYRNRAVPSRWWRELFVFSICMAFTGIFEIIEYLTALAFGSASAAYLGSQGDIWDAQNDMILCGIGTIVSILCWGPFHLRELRRERQGTDESG